MSRFVGTSTVIFVLTLTPDLIDRGDSIVGLSLGEKSTYHKHQRACVFDSIRSNGAVILQGPALIDLPKTATQPG